MKRENLGGKVNLGTGKQTEPWKRGGKKKSVKVTSHLTVKFTHTISNLSAAAFWMQQGKGILGKLTARSGEIQFSWLLGRKEDTALSTLRKANCIINTRG